MNLLELLNNENVAEFNSTRSQRGRLDLFAADLSEKKLIGADLSSANLQKADLTGTDLTDCSLTKADLSGTDGAGLILDGSIGMKIRLREAWLEKADLTGVDFTKGDLSGATLNGSKATMGRFTRARFKGVEARATSWVEVDLSEASLHKGNFSESDLSRADLTSASATHSIFEKSKLDGAIGSNGNFSAANFTGASLVGARFDGANFSGADFSGADLSAVDFSRANLSEAIFTDATLTGACFADACVDGVSFADLNVEQVDMTGLEPGALGLSDSQIEQLSSYGSIYDPTAALVIQEPVGAISNDALAIVWTNPDSEELKTIRWAIVRKGEDVKTGVLSISEESVVGMALLGEENGFRIMSILNRPGGVALSQIPLSLDGVIGEARTDGLMYGPAVTPIYRWVQGHLLVVGMARRGPTVILQLVTDEGLRVYHSSQIATARGFMSRHDPVLACKGEVVRLVGSKGAGNPVRTPPSFPGNRGVVAPYGGKLHTIWHETLPGEDGDGVLRVAELGARKGVEVRDLHHVKQIISLDAVAHKDGIWMAWVQPGKKVLSTEAYRCLWPNGDIERIDMGTLMPRTIRFALGKLMKETNPGVVITTMDEEAVCVGGDGAAIGQVGGE